MKKTNSINLIPGERADILAKYIICQKTTVREAAKQFSVSKSTVHKDVTEKLKKTNPSLYSQVNEILQQNKAERHLRGGKATREKYLHSAKENC